MRCHVFIRRVKGLKGKKAWEYQRTISASSISSVRSPSPTPSPSHSPTPSPDRNSLNVDIMTGFHLKASKSDESSLDVTNGATRK